MKAGSAREEFLLPEGIYLDGNSLGPMPRAARLAVLRHLQIWETKGVRGWDEWCGLAESLGPALGRLVGAHPDEVIATGSITVNLHALLSTFHVPTAGRRHLVATGLDFPTDLYAMRSWADARGVELRLIPSRDGHTLHLDDVLAHLAGDVALVLLPTVLYRSGQLLDVSTITREARSRGIVIGWDAAHAVGAVPGSLHDDDADFAVWCHYKYVNAGPGAPGGMFVHRRHHARLPALRGWWGNAETSRFAMASEYEKADGAAAFQLGTPSILALAALEGALSLFDQVGIAAVRARSLALTGLLLELLDRHVPELRVVTPRREAERGGHIAVSHPQARAISAHLRANGVVPDHRAPDLVRLAPVALYTTEAEVEAAVSVLRQALDGPLLTPSTERVG